MATTMQNFHDLNAANAASPDGARYRFGLPTNSPALAPEPSENPEQVEELPADTYKLNVSAPKFGPDQLIRLGLAAISLGGLFLFWYLGTKYRWDFYILSLIHI